MKTTLRANARAMMREGHSPSKAVMAAHEMKCAANGFVGGPDEELPSDDRPDIGMQPQNDPGAPHMADGGVLSAASRNRMKASTFAGPDRSYPINDASHARNALARVSQFGSPALKAKVRAKVHSKFPGIGKK